MSYENAIAVRGLSKCYQIYDQPRHRLLQMLFRGWRQYYREFWALRDVSFNVKRGETVAIIGRNGSGKSTLLQLLCGTLTPTVGSVEVAGRVAALLELGAGFNPEFTGRENVFLNAAILGLSKPEIEKRFPQIEAFAEIGSFIDQPVKTYSSGMYVRLAFSVAIHTDPQVLVVDEALSVGDARFQAKCLNRIKQMKEAGVSILFVSHDINAVRSLCDRAIWLDKGGIRLSGQVFSVTAEYTEFLFDDAVFVSDVANAPANTNSSGQSRVHKPINHWGTHIGSISSAGVYDANGKLKSVLHRHEPIEVKIRFRVVRGVDRATLGVAFSFKDLSGADLIVGSSAESAGVNFTEDRDEYEVCFKLENYLNTGEYLLVAAIEDRSSASIQYYEYIEGAQYFSSISEDRHSGRFIPKIIQSVI